MATGKIFTVKVRRKRKGLTNYKKRLGLLKSGITRLVVRRSNKYIMLQLVNYAEQGDKVLTTLTSAKLDEFGWKYSKNSIPASYLVGALLAKKAAEFKVTEAILDMGFLRSIAGNRLYAVVKGAIDAGLNVHCDDVVFPSAERLRGEHIVTHAEKNKDQFTGYTKVKADPAQLSNTFDAVKAKIIGAK